MSYFMNPFTADYTGNLFLGDRHHHPSFKCPRNAGRGDNFVIAWTQGNYDLSGNDADSNSTDTLVVYLSTDMNFQQWVSISLDVSGSTAAATTPTEIVTAINNDDTFSSYFEANLEKFPGSTVPDRILIRQKFPPERMRFYVANGRAEEKIRFNARAGVAELPTYFDRHKVVHLFTAAEKLVFTDSMNTLVPLQAGVLNVDDDVIDNAVDDAGTTLGLDSGTVQEDWQLMEGKSGLFNFQKITVDGSDRITEIIEYPAGAVAGDFARKISYSYTSTNTKPDQVTEEPYTLASGDLVTP